MKEHRAEFRYHDLRTPFCRILCERFLASILAGVVAGRALLNRECLQHGNIGRISSRGKSHIQLGQWTIHPRSRLSLTPSFFFLESFPLFINGFLCFYTFQSDFITKYGNVTASEKENEKKKE